MRGVCLVLALFGVPAIAAAQSPPQARAGAAPSPPVAVARPVDRPGSMGPIGLPLPSIGLPLPSIGLSPQLRDDQRWNGNQQRGNDRGGNQRDGQWRDGQGSYNPFRHQRSGPAYVYVTPPYPYYNPYPYYPYYGAQATEVVVQATTVPGVITVVPEPATGRFLLEVEPADVLQVFVDGEYVGTPADLGSTLDLRPGSRRIEFRAPGYRSLTIDAQIVSQRTIVYRATLDRIAPTRVVPPPAPPAPPPAPAAPFMPSGNRTMYLIPGCYMGNVPPQDLKLPPGCDLSKLTTITP